MKFIADCMLGTLAKWLRLLGYDTLYFNHAEDSELARIAAQEDRILLTRDNELADRRLMKGRHVFIKSGKTGEQVRQVVEELSLPIIPGMFLTRCCVCNGEIEDVPKGEVEDLVPPYVFATQEQFGKCRSCGKIYWHGTHVGRILKSIEAKLSI